MKIEKADIQFSMESKKEGLLNTLDALIHQATLIRNSAALDNFASAEGESERLLYLSGEVLNRATKLNSDAWLLNILEEERS